MGLLKNIAKFTRSASLIGVAAAFAACADNGVLAPDSFKPSGEVVALNASATWLAPLGNGVANPATFDAQSITSVEVCAWVANACSGAPVATFARTPVSGQLPLTANTVAGRYEAKLNLLDTRFLTRKTYKIRVLRSAEQADSILVDIIRGRWALTRTDGTVAPLVAASELNIQFHVAVPPPQVKINEVESNGGTPGDWVELYNAGSTAADISGFVFMDNDDAHTYAIPAGTIIPAGGYYVLEEAAFGFGLGGNETARLYLPGGALLDSYSWLTHAPTTYGRCPNGAGDFVTMSTVTKGTVNDCSIPNTVRINEIESSGGEPGDWIELYNSGAIAVNVGGFVVKDNNDASNYTIPAGTIINPGAYLVLEESQFVFGLGASDAVRLYGPMGDLRDSYTWTSHAPTTYGRCPNGGGAFATMSAVTKGAANSCAVVTTLKINEAESNGGVPGDWVELINTGSTPLDISGFVFKDNDDAHIYSIPANTVIAAGGFFVLDEAQFVFGLGADETVRIFDQGGVLVDSYAWTAHAPTTYGRCPDGTGAFAVMTTVTKGAANDCGAPNTVKINEVESSGGTPGDWTELYNTGALPVDISGYQFIDNDTTHTRYVVPAATVIAAGGYYIIEEAAQGFGLGGADGVRLYDKSGQLRDTYDWTAHASTTYGRCPNGTGAFTTTTSVTKGAANDCSAASPIKINEAESNGGTPGDWVELFNTSASAVNISGFIFRDNDDAHTYVIPAGTTIAAGGYYVLEEAVFGFGLGGAESVRLYNASDALIDSYTWAAHATTTYGRCPNGTGAFVTMNTVTKGTVNDCGVTPPTGPVPQAWPGLDNVTTVDVQGTFSSNLSGLVYEAGAGPGGTDVLWAARNGPGSIYRMIFNGTNWVPDANNGWANGKLTKYTDGNGEPDTENLAYTTGSSAGMYIASERNNQASGVSRPSILRYDVTGSGTTLVATHEWVLTADLPTVGANAGLEAITWIPDSYLVSQGFYDVAKSKLYNPADYPNSGGGLFFVGLEGNGVVYVYSLDHSNSTFTRITSFSTGFPAGVMALQFDRELGQLWAVCDDTCEGRSNIYVIDVTPASPTLGRMKLTNVF
ncbi:MAG: lamin tail domain-containing protein, partial [Gemmatimonas sp.]